MLGSTSLALSLNLNDVSVMPYFTLSLLHVKHRLAIGRKLYTLLSPNLPDCQTARWPQILGSKR